MLGKRYPGRRTKDNVNDNDNTFFNFRHSYRRIHDYTEYAYRHVRCEGQVVIVVYVLVSRMSVTVIGHLIEDIQAQRHTPLLMNTVHLHLERR